MMNLSWLPFERYIDHPSAHWNAVNSVPYLSPSALGNDHHAGPEVCVQGLVVTAQAPVELETTAHLDLALCSGSDGFSINLAGK